MRCFVLRATARPGLVRRYSGPCPRRSWPTVVQHVGIFHNGRYPKWFAMPPCPGCGSGCFVARGFWGLVVLVDVKRCDHSTLLVDLGLDRESLFSWLDWSMPPKPS